MLKFHLRNYTISLFLFFTFSLFAQQAVQLAAYGIWDRSTAIDTKAKPQYDYIKGSKCFLTWANLQPTDSLTYRWDLLLNQIKSAVAQNQYIKTNIEVGPEAPEWLYSVVTPVVTNDTKHTKWPKYPFYKDPDYLRHYNRLIKDFASFIKGLDPIYLDHICFVQVQTGCTGDECAYKGVPLDRNLVINATEWADFRAKAFSEFKNNFNDAPGRKIALLFNNIDPVTEPNEWKWVNDSIDPNVGFGTKGGGYARGHHINGEKSFKETWSKYLLNPKGMKVFSGEEMDLTWQAPVYRINVPLGMYWGMLSALNTGIGVWDITGNALQAADTCPQLHDVFRMFSKYAPQVYPATASCAYSIFHEGLNSNNTLKFGKTYGTTTQSNGLRYVNICNIPLYKSHGARMDDTIAVKMNQASERPALTGYNDAGFDIEEGNFERWINQINPDAESIGLFRVGGNINANSSIYSRFARAFEYKTSRNAMLFKYHAELFSLTTPDSLKFTVTWLDSIQGSKWALKYQSTQGVKTAREVLGTGDGSWKKEVFVVKDAEVIKAAADGSYFSLVNTDTLDDIFHGIELDIYRKGVQTALPANNKNSDPAVIIFPNPTASIVKIESAEEIKAIELCDLSGKRLLKITNQNDNGIDLSPFQNGIYFLKISFDNRVVVRKITKE